MVTSIQGSREPSEEPLSCGELVFDFWRQLVTRADVPVDLCETYRQALFLLIERRPHAVSKAELVRAAATTEDSLYKVVETIRKALGDTEEPRRLIATERGVGYRFIGRLDPIRPDPLSEGARSRSTGITAGNRISRWKWRAAAFAVALAVAGVAAWGFHSWHRGVPIAEIRVEGPFLIALDRSGKEAWRHFFPEGLSGNGAYAAPAFFDRYWIGDLDGDGKTELLFGYQPSDSRSRSSGLPGATLLCFNQDESLRWSFPVGRAIRDNVGPILPLFTIDRILVVPSDGLRHRPARLVVGSGHPTDQAYQVAFLDPAGKLIGEYWHPGAFRKFRLIPGTSGRPPMVLAAGVNNGEHTGTLVMLDPFAVRGSSSPSRMKDQRFRILDMAEADEEIVILFPRLCLGRLDPYTRVEYLDVDRFGVRAKYFDGYLTPNERMSYYDFDFSLHPTRAFVSTDYREEHIRLEVTGQVHDSWRDDEAKLLTDLKVKKKAH